MTKLIKNLEADTLYTASIHMYSRGEKGEVTIALEVSHPLDDEFEGDAIPAAYAQAQELIMGLRRGAVIYASSDEDSEFLANPEISAADKAAMVLDKVAAQEEALKATIN